MTNKRSENENMKMDSKRCYNTYSQNGTEICVSKRANMPLSQRAKQFAPFQALSMLSVALKQVEDEHENKVNTEYYENVDANHVKNSNSK